MIIYGPFPYVDEKTVPVMNPWFELVYGVFHRALWSAVLAFVIFLCFYGYGGIKSASKRNNFLLNTTLFHRKTKQISLEQDICDYFSTRLSNILGQLYRYQCLRILLADPIQR